MAMTAERKCGAVSNPNHKSNSSRESIPVGVDFISSLPDVILHDILSYIPSKVAIKTSVLSKRWKRVWHETPSISISCCREDHVYSIDKTLSTYPALKIKSLYLRISHHINTKLVDRWIKLAKSRNVEDLSFKLSYYDPIPDYFYINPSAKQLSLTSRYKYLDLDPKCIVSWTSLRNLSLSHCRLSDESFASILSGCPMLESLILNKCDGINCLDLSRSVNLKIFEKTDDSSIWHGTKIVAPHIHYLSLTSFHQPDTLIDVFSLTHAKFNLEYIGYIGWQDLEYIRYIGWQDIIDLVLKMLAKLQDIDNLTIGVVVLQILSIAELCGIPFPELKIKSLTVETMLVRSVIPGVIRLLQNSPGLEKITFYTTKSKAIPDKTLNIYLAKEGLNIDRCWNNLFPTVVNTTSSFISGHVALFMELVKTRKSEYQNLVSMVPLRKHGQLNGFEIML